MRTVIRSLVLAVTLVACTEPRPLRLTLTVDRTALAVQDSIKLSLELINQTSRTVKTYAGESYGFCLHAFRVYDNQDREVPVNTGLCIAALVAAPQTDLLPGHSISITDYWYPGAGGVLAAVAPGEYRIVGLVYADDKAVSSGSRFVAVLPAP